VAVFAAVAMVLNAIRIPAIMWPGLWYPLCEIPIVIACLLFGFKIAIMAGSINLIGQLAFFQINPGSIVGYPMGFLALLVTLFGIYVAKKIIIARNESSKEPFNEKRKAAYLIGLAMVFRACIMPFSDYFIFYGILLPLVGIPIPEAYRAALFPYFILFNVMVPLYTVPISILVATKVGNITKITLSVFK
jgi:thiamine transporter ThiT